LAIPWTARELDAWFEKLPARERAELSWARPGFKEALDSLIEGPLTPADIEAAVRRITKVSLGWRGLRRRMLQGQFPWDAWRKALLSLLPATLDFLRIPLAAAHAERAVQVAIAVSRTSEQAIQRLPQESPTALKTSLEEADLDALVDEELASSSADLMRGYALIAALLEAAERNADADRGRELARLA